MGLLGSIGTAIKSGAQTAVGVAPYAARMIAENEARGRAAAQLALKNSYEKQANDRANAMLKLAQDNATRAAEGEWEKGEPMTTSDGQTIVVQRNKRTGVYRRAVLDDSEAGAPPAPSVPTAPGTPINAAPKSVIPDAAIGRGPSVAAPSAPMPGDSQDMGGESPTPQVASIEQAGQTPQTPVAPKPRTLKPYVKPNPNADKLTPRNFKLNGKDVAGFTDAQGNYYDSNHQKVSGNVAPYTPPVQQSYSFPVVGGPNGPVVARANNKTGQIETTDIAGKAPTGSGGSASLSPEDRAKMLAQAKIDNATMKRIEQRVLNGELNFGTAAGLAGAASQAHGGVGHEMLGVIGNAVAGKIDPDIQNYFTAQASYGRIMGNLQSKRYTDHQADIERRISGMAGNDLHNTIAYKQQLRDASIDDPDIQPKTTAAPPARSGRGGGRGSGPPPNVPHPPNRNDTPGNINLAGGSGTPTREQQLWDAAVAKHGQAKVLAEFGPRPE